MSNLQQAVSCQFAKYVDDVQTALSIHANNTDTVNHIAMRMMLRDLINQARESTSDEERIHAMAALGLWPRQPERAHYLKHDPNIRNMLEVNLSSPSRHVVASTIALLVTLCDAVSSVYLVDYLPLVLAAIPSQHAHHEQDKTMNVNLCVSIAHFMCRVVQLETDVGAPYCIGDLSNYDVIQRMLYLIHTCNALSAPAQAEHAAATLVIMVAAHGAQGTTAALDCIMQLDRARVYALFAIHQVIASARCATLYTGPRFPQCIQLLVDDAGMLVTLHTHPVYANQTGCSLQEWAGVVLGHVLTHCDGQTRPHIMALIASAQAQAMQLAMGVPMAPAMAHAGEPPVAPAGPSTLRERPVHP